MELGALDKAGISGSDMPPVQAGACADACLNCPVRDKAVCGRLSLEALAELNRIGRHRQLRKGQTLYWEGDDAPVVANVLSGMVKLTAATPAGDEQIVGVIGPSGFLGRPSGGASDHGVEALVDTSLCVFPGAAFQAFLHDHRELGEALLERAYDELDRARRWQMMLARASAAERVAGMLLEFTAKHPVEGQAYAFPLSRGQMADLAGLTIETVSRQLTKMRAAGVIDLPNRNDFIVHDRAALAALAGDTARQGLH